MEQSTTILHKIVTLILKLSVVAYVFATVIPFITDPGFENEFGIWAVRWSLIILLAAIAFGIFVLDRSLFYKYGFLLVAIASVFQLFIATSRPTGLIEIVTYFYILSTSFYFLTRDIRQKSGKRRLRSRKVKSTSE